MANEGPSRLRPSQTKILLRSMMSATRDIMIEGGHQVTISDLYRDQFNPVASAADYVMRRDPSYLSSTLEQRHAIAGDTCAPDVAREVEQVLAVDCLLLIFSYFLVFRARNSERWIDPLLHVRLVLRGRRFYSRGAMASRRALIIASVGASSHMFGPRGIHGEFQPMFRHLTRGILGCVGYDVLAPFWALHVSYVSDDERRETLGRLRQHLDGLDSLPILSVPDLARYDRQCRPLPQRTNCGASEKL